MKTKIWLAGWVFFFALGFASAQPPRGPRMSPDEMAQREKQNLYKKLTDLSEDQKMLLDGIYEEFGDSVNEKFEEVRKTRDREKMRAAMSALHEEKTALIGDVLNENQMEIYNEMVLNRKKQMEKRRREARENPK